MPKFETRASCFAPKRARDRGPKINYIVQPVILSKSCETVDSNLKYWKFRGGKKFRRREKILSSRGCMKLFQTRLHVGQKQLATLTTASKIFRSSWLAQETENKSWTLRVFLVLLAAFLSSTRKKMMKRKQRNINYGLKQEFRWPRTHPTQGQSCSLILHFGSKKKEIIYLSLFTFCRPKTINTSRPFWRLKFWR